MTATTLTALIVAPTFVGNDDARSNVKPPRVGIGQPAFYSTKCADAYNAVRWYRARYDKSRTELGFSLAPRIETGMDCERLRLRAAYWVGAAKVNRLAAKRWRDHQYGWTKWMPRGSKWFRVASCETGYGRDPNWAHDSGSYVSAFGIYRDGYADDAHRVGNLSWDETKRRLGRLPTPREQYEAALSHYRAHGGFSGWGCRGA